MFFLLNLTKWLVYFDGSDPKEDREIKLTRYLAFNAGFYATPAGVRLNSLLFNPEKIA